MDWQLLDERARPVLPKVPFHRSRVRIRIPFLESAGWSERALVTRPVVHTHLYADRQAHERTDSSASGRAKMSAEAETGSCAAEKADAQTYHAAAVALFDFSRKPKIKDLTP